MWFPIPARRFALAVLFAGSVLFSGTPAANGASSLAPASAGTQTATPGLWSQIAQTIPRSRFNAQMAYDAARQQMVLFSGCCDPDVHLDGTWVRSGTTWTEVHPVNSPPSREGGTMVYDAATRTVVLFGGSSDTGSLNDTWTWDGTNWTQQFPATPPPARYFAGMSYDAGHSQVVLFGGAGGDAVYVPLGDTWIWDGTNWTQQHPLVSPPTRVAASMAYDAASHQTVLFGGGIAGTSICVPYVLCEPVGDTWTWDGSNWTLHLLVVSPPARVQASMAYDAPRGQIVLFGGAGAGHGRDTWTWDGSSWLPHLPATSPGARQAASMEYDAQAQLVVLFAGCCRGPQDDTWTWDGNTWSEVPRTWPENRFGAGMARDAATGQVVLFGGRDYANQLFNDTWTWDGTSWTEQHPSVSPPARVWTNVVYDAATKQLVLFGGNTGTSNLNDTWTWDGTSWTQQFPTNSPSPRRAPAMAYDAATGQVVLFGGYDGVSQSDLNDTWTWDGTNWTQQTPSTSPPARQFATMAYDPPSNQVVLFGGWIRSSNTFLNDTWTWDGTNWTEQHPVAAPSSRYNSTMAYDATTQMIELFGGSNSTCPNKLCDYNDTWGWNGSNWVQQDAGSSVVFQRSLPGRPSARTWAASAATGDGRVMLFGGDEYGHAVNDAWLLSISPTAAHVTRFTATRHGATVIVRWRVARPRDVVGFELVAGGHRLNRRLIRAHAGSRYRYTVHGRVTGRIGLLGMLADGRVVPLAHS